MTLFRNSSGAGVAVFAASFGSQYELSSFGFYDEDRKRELIELIEWVCNHPVAYYYPGDAEIYIKVRRFADGRDLLALFNLGHDPLDTIPIVSAYAITEVEMIMPEGRWQEIVFADGCLLTPLLPAEPKVFRITTEQSVIKE